MRRIVVAILLALALTASNVRADVDLIAAVNATFGARTVDATLHDIAHQRAVEVVTDWSHNGMRDGTSEVLALNQFHSDPIASAIRQWSESPTHAAILNDDTLTRIGCAEYVTPDETHWFACVLAREPSVIDAPGPAGQPPNVGGSESTPLPALPNTATAP
jgi:hypothetical protein